MVLPIVAAARAAAAKKHKAAIAKVSRLKKQGVDIAGTEFDPRKSWDVVKRYNTKQLNAYMERLDQFNLRTRKFTALADRQPITQHVWNQFKKSEDRVNEIRNKILEAYGNLTPPDSTTTVAERMAKHSEANPSSIFAPRDAQRQNITSAESLRKLQEFNERNADPDYQAKRLTAARTSAGKMLDEYGDDDLSSLVGTLSDEQFDVLWNHTNFRDNLIHGYATKLGKEGGRAKNQIVEDELDRARDLADWASSLQV